MPSLIGVVEGDEVTADQISGDRQTDAGSYTAKVGGLAGKDSGNYVLEESVYCWSIAPAEGAPENTVSVSGGAGDLCAGADSWNS